MKPSLIKKLTSLQARLNELNHLLSQESATADLQVYKKLSQEHAEITPVVAHFEQYQTTLSDIETAEAFQTDPEMKDFALEEIEIAKRRLSQIEEALTVLLIPKDPNDDRNLFLEIRAGTGGEESALFASDLYRMYARYAERQRWKFEIISSNTADMGGYKELIMKIEGFGAYSQLKFESGGHRVQRVPETEAQGRIHTSACTVAVLAEVDEVADVQINPADIRIDTFRASGAGGQHINKTDSAVRITHIPTGIVVECQDDRSQHRNKAQALHILAARIKDAEVQAQQSKIAHERKSLIGSGDRSERIRTYNFPQGRVTDHRINLTLYKIESIMDGDLAELVSALSTEWQAEQLANLAGED